MYVSKVSPTGKERVMKPEDVIISKTDLRGIITYCNDIFVEYAQMETSVLYGSPHSIIRHPDMPRAVFKLLWDEVQAGRELFAFVKNLGADGAHYWVFAQIIPEIAEGRTVGYFSFRRAPRRAALPVLETLYEKMRSEEKRLGGAAGMEASLKLLMDTARSKNKSYEELILELQGA
jgi:hypothetical protein